MSEATAPYVEEVSPGIHAYVQPDGSWWLNNAAFVVAHDHVVLVDTCATEARTRSLLQAVRAVTTRPIRTLVSTHHHGDHTHGNCLVEGAARIGHRRCRERMRQWGVVTGTHPLFPTVEWGNLALAPPELTFEDRLALHVDDLALELIHIGPAHTDNDVVVWIADRRVLLAGDLVFDGGTPFCVFGSVAGSLAALEPIRALDPDVIVPGHGPVCGLGVLGPIEAYLRFVEDAARRGLDAGMAPLDVAREADLGSFAEWRDTERLVGNLHRAYAELRGEEPAVDLDYRTVWTEMVAYNGGLPRCLA